MLAPIVRLTLYCGLGHSEFAAVVRRVFVDVASDEYGLRGRPANVSKISAKTGISRKSIQKLRSEWRSTEWSTDDDVSPINNIIHYWRFDNEYGSPDGTPRALPYEGKGSFVELVKKYVGDIPASTIRQEFLRTGLAISQDDGLLKLVRNFSFPEKLDEEFLRYAAFSIGNHAETLFHNALIADSEMNDKETYGHGRRFDRIAWARLTPVETRKFEDWVRQHSEEFILEADRYVGQHEYEVERDESSLAPVSGVGVYFFIDRGAPHSKGGA
jgi:hypothetical protein